MRKNIFVSASGVVAVTLVSAVAFAGANGVAAAEPLRLDTQQLDAVTAGLALSKTGIRSFALGKRGTLAVGSATTNAISQGARQAYTSSAGVALAAGDKLADTGVDNLSLIADQNAHAGVQTTTEGTTLGDKAVSLSEGGTSAVQMGGNIGAEGAGYTYAEGDSGVSVSGGTGASATGTTSAKTGSRSAGYATLSRGLVTTDGQAISCNP